MMRAKASATILLAVAAACFLAAQPAAAGGVYEGSNVVELTTESFEHRTQASTGQTAGIWFVKFHAPWCGHCAKLGPTWAELADDLQGEVAIAAVDCDAHKEIQKRFGFLVEGFPTLILFRDRGAYKYNGPRTKEALVDFIRGGYAKVPKSGVPGPPNALIVAMDNIVEVVHDQVMKISRVLRANLPNSILSKLQQAEKFLITKVGLKVDTTIMLAMYGLVAAMLLMLLAACVGGLSKASDGGTQYLQVPKKKEEARRTKKDK
mmetsp:Transcript_56079/g.177696  ORF Transcript_56079/g.177696 Transcript_56079/m.177696 type:complete len:263 (+) Transcript_56079:209-997(+)